MLVDIVREIKRDIKRCGCAGKESDDDVGKKAVQYESVCSVSWSLHAGVANVGSDHGVVQSYPLPFPCLMPVFGIILGEAM